MPNVVGPAGQVSAIVDGWWAGSEPSTEVALAGAPDLARRRAAKLSLAYSEFCVREAQGNAPSAESFCERFPDIRSSLARRLIVHDLVGANADQFYLPEPDWPAEGEQLLGFRLQEQLGEGGFSRVFLAEDVALDRHVVVKVSSGPVAEAKTLAKLDHDFVVPIFSTGYEEGRQLSICVMPFASRHTLSDCLDVAFSGGRRARKWSTVLDKLGEGHEEADYDRLAQEGMDLPRDAYYIDAVIEIIRQLAMGLAHTHARGVLHLDIKPSNVLITPTGRPMLMDFNLSVERGSASQLAGGTLPYMSPEQIRALSDERATTAVNVDARSDLYSLGVVFFELLVGKHPFLIDNWKCSFRAIAARLLTCQLDAAGALTRYPRRLDPALVRTVVDCLAPDPHHRIQTADELAWRCQELLRPGRRVFRHATTDRKTCGIYAGCMLLLIVLLSPWITSFVGAALARGYVNVACRELLASDYTSAGVSFSSANWLSPNGETLTAMGYCATRQGRHQQAVEYYRQAIAAGFDTPDVQAALGYNYQRLGQAAKARTFLLEAVDRYPEYQPVYVLLASADCLPDAALLKQARQWIAQAEALGSLRGLGHLRAAMLALHADLPPLVRRATVLHHWRAALEAGVRPANVFVPFERSFLRSDRAAEQALRDVQRGPPYDDFSDEIPIPPGFVPYLAPPLSVDELDVDFDFSEDSSDPLRAVLPPGIDHSCLVRPPDTN